MKFSCQKNDLRAVLKPFDKFVSIFKGRELELIIQVDKQVTFLMRVDDYRMQVVFTKVEIQESGQLKLSYENLQKLIKSMKRNVLLSFRERGGKGVELLVVTPEGEMHRIPAQTSFEGDLDIIEKQAIMNLSMDEFWQSLIQVHRVVPKKHLIDVFTKVKWVVSDTGVRWVAANQFELAIKHFQSLISEGSQLFYLKGTDMEIIKKCVSAVTEQRMLIETTAGDLVVSGEYFSLEVPIERAADVPLEQLVVRDMARYSLDVKHWIHHINQELETLSQQEATMTAKQLKYRVTVVENQIQLHRAIEDERGAFSADEFLKIFKNDQEGEWQCWISPERPMISFVKQESTTQFYLYLLTFGLM